MRCYFELNYTELNTNDSLCTRTDNIVQQCTTVDYAAMKTQNCILRQMILVIPSL